MGTIAITGVSGYIAQRLLHRLESDDTVDRVIGIDVVEPKTRSKKLDFHRLDIRDPQIADVISGADIVAHLAFILNPMQDEQLMRDINVEGTRNVLRAVEEAGVKKLVYTSSIVAYGARPDNDYPLTEDSPLRANTDFNYAEHKLEVELLLRRWKERHEGIILTILRFAIVFGPHVQNFISRTLESPRIFAVRGYRPPLQFLHEEDAAESLYFAIGNDLDGAYNVCPDDEIPFDEILQMAGKKTLDLPQSVILPMAKIGWKLGLLEAPAGEINYLMYPAIMSSEKLRGAGFEFKYSSRDALAEALDANRGWVTIGRWRMSEDTYRSRVGAAKAGAAALATLYLLRRWRKRRSSAKA
jgi:UDP-glucose 4-epimerase